GRARPSAVAAARRIFYALEIAQQRDRIRPGAAQLDHLTETAAAGARAARAVTEFAPIKHDRRDGLRGFHRNGAHAGWEGGGAETILRGPRAGAAAVEDHRAELRQRVGVGTLLDLVDQRAAAEHLRIPQRGGAFRRHAA